MKFILLITFRYIFAKKKQNIINIISFISLFAIAIVSAALILLLSVFNGFDSLIRNFYTSFDPDIKIISNSKTKFIPDKELLSFLNSNKEINDYSFVLEENAMLKYDEKQVIATLKGVDDNYISVTCIDSIIRRGIYSLGDDKYPLAVAGWGLAYNLLLDFEGLQPITIYIPSRTKNYSGNYMDINENINSLKIYASGAFETFQEEYDAKYIILPLDKVQKLTERDDGISSIEIKLNDYKNYKSFISNFYKKFNNLYSALDKNMQHENVYKILKSEKLMIFVILIFVLIIASFNFIATLSMIILDKKKDIEILLSLGAKNASIKIIFFLQGLIINFMGILIGFILGTIICLIQMKFGLISLGNGENYIVQNYPVKIIASDYFLVFIAVMIIGVVASILPLRMFKTK